MLDSHGCYMCAVFHLWQRFSQWIRDVVVSSNLANLDFLSFNDLSKYMKSPQYVLGLLVAPRLLCLGNGPAIVAIQSPVSYTHLTLPTTERV